MKEIVDKLGLQYNKTGLDEYRLFDGWKLTDGRTFCDKADKRLVRDHSNRGRPQWDQFWFVKWVLNIDDKETFQRFNDNFNINAEDKTATVMEIWSKLMPPSEWVRQYLKSRGVQYDKVADVVREYAWWLWCLIWWWGRPKGICARRMTDDHKNRFVSLTWFSNTWLYKWELDPEKDYVYVVEWMMDFLTIRQYDKNVVGLHNCEKWFEDVIKLAETYEIIFIPDNDEAWTKSKKFLEDVPHKVVNLSEWEKDWIKIKDINDFHRYIVGPDGEYWEMFMELLMQNAQFEGAIKSVFTKLKKARKIISERWMLWEPGPIKEVFDDICMWVIEWKVYTIAAYSNVGKSRLSYDWCSYFLKQKKKVLFINLEVSDYFCLWHIIASTEWVSHYDAMSTHEAKESLYKNLTIKDDVYKLETICEHIHHLMPDIVFIDFMQNIEAWWSDYEKHSKIARTIQRVAIETNATIFAISQLPNTALANMRMWNFDEITPKGAWEYFASSDVIFLIHSAELANGERVLVLTVQKNKFWEAKSQHVLNPNWPMNRFGYWWRFNKEEYCLKEQTKSRF